MIMRLKLLLFCFISVFCISMTACGESDVKSVLNEESAETAAESDPHSEEFEDEYEVPSFILELTEEEDLLLTGTLKDRTYTNDYFGYVLTVPEGWTLSSFNEPGEDGELMRFSKTYTDGFYGIMIDSSYQDMMDNISVYISDLKEEQIGLSEDELIKADLEFDKKLSKSTGSENNAQIETLNFAGKDHPAITETYTGDDGKERTSVHFVVPKGNYKYDVSIMAVDYPPEELLEFFKEI